MIIIVGILLLLTLPFFIYAVYKTVPIKKHMFIIYEVIAVAVLLFCSTLVVLDIPYIINGGQFYDDGPLYYMGKVEIGNGNDTYWLTKDLFGDDVAEAKVYVLPHTHLVYKIETNDFFDPVPYHIMDFSMFAMMLIVLEGIFLWGVIDAWYKWS